MEIKDKKPQKEKGLTLLGIGLVLFAVMGLVMFSTVWPIGNYLMSTDIPR